MKKGDGPFGDDEQRGAGNPFGGDNVFVQGLPKTNSGSPENFDITDARKITTQVIPGIGGSKRGSDLIKPAFVIPGVGPGGDEIVDPTIVIDGSIPVQAVIHIVVFAKYQPPGGGDIINAVGNLHAFSGHDFHLVLAGYSPTKPEDSDHSALCVPREISLRPGVTWFYDDNEFVKQVGMVLAASTWKYKGGLQLLICDVKTPSGQPANIREMFVDKKAACENVILIDVDKIIANKLFLDFDHFFHALRNIIQEIRSVPNSNTSPTWQLSDRLGLRKGGGVMRKAFFKALKLEFNDAYDEAMTLESFTVKDICKTYSRD